MTRNIKVVIIVLNRAIYLLLKEQRRGEFINQKEMLHIRLLVNSLETDFKILALKTIEYLLENEQCSQSMEVDKQKVVDKA